MPSDPRSSMAVRAGYFKGSDLFNGEGGELRLVESECVLRVVEHWDMDVISPWRRVLPRSIFEGFNGRATSKLYITTHRIVLVRKIDSWREVKGEMTPLGMPVAIAKKVELDRLSRIGTRQYCEIWPAALRLVSSKKLLKGNSWVSLNVLDLAGTQYGIMIWKTDGRDDETLALIESLFVGSHAHQSRKS